MLSEIVLSEIVVPEIIVSEIVMSEIEGRFEWTFIFPFEKISFQP